jgi:hypothetical protein
MDTDHHSSVLELEPISEGDYCSERLAQTLGLPDFVPQDVLLGQHVAAELPFQRKALFTV